MTKDKRLDGIKKKMKEQYEQKEKEVMDEIKSKGEVSYEDAAKADDFLSKVEDKQREQTEGKVLEALRELKEEESKGKG